MTWTILLVVCVGCETYVEMSRHCEGDAVEQLAKDLVRQQGNWGFVCHLYALIPFKVVKQK